MIAERDRLCIRFRTHRYVAWPGRVGKPFRANRVTASGRSASGLIERGMLLTAETSKEFA